MRCQLGLCAVRHIYALLFHCMNGQKKLCVVILVYARLNNIMRTLFLNIVIKISI